MERFTNAAFGFEVTDVPAVGVGGPESAVILARLPAGPPQARPDDR